MINALRGYIEHLVEHKEIQRQRDREIQYRISLLDTMPVGILIIDSTGRVSEANHMRETGLARVRVGRFCLIFLWITGN